MEKLKKDFTNNVLSECVAVLSQPTLDLTRAQLVIIQKEITKILSLPEPVDLTCSAEPENFVNSVLKLTKTFHTSLHERSS